MKKEKKYSYIRYPYSIPGWYSLGLGCTAAVLSFLVLFFSVKRAGEASLFHGALGLCALLLSASGLLIAVFGRREKERNFRFLRIGGGISLIILVIWIRILML